MFAFIPRLWIGLKLQWSDSAKYETRRVIRKYTSIGGGGWWLRYSNQMLKENSLQTSPYGYPPPKQLMRYQMSTSDEHLCANSVWIFTYIFFSTPLPIASQSISFTGTQAFLSRTSQFVLNTVRISLSTNSMLLGRREGLFFTKCLKRISCAKQTSRRRLHSGVTSRLYKQPFQSVRCS